jgi:hypothetical protein
VVTGASASTSYQLPLLGAFAHENVVANPFAQDTTIVAGMDDTTPTGRVFIYNGTKLGAGTPVDRAGLTNGLNWAVQVRVNGVNIATESRDFGLATSGPGGTQRTFGLRPGGANGTSSTGPEDGAWDPENPDDFYFVTTDRIDLALRTASGRRSPAPVSGVSISSTSRSRRFGGTIGAVGTEGNMFDNMHIDRLGQVIIQEDTGGNVHNAKIWSYDIHTGHFNLLTMHDPARFGDVTIPATAPFTIDEESSGVIPMADILGNGTFLIDVQAHYNIGDPQLVEGGQLLLMRLPGRSQGKH